MPASSARGAAAGIDETVTLDRCFAAVAISATIGMTLAYRWGAADVSPQFVLALAFTCVLVCALAGLFAQQRVAELRRADVARTYVTAVHTNGGSRIATFAGTKTPFERASAALADMADAISLRFAGHASVARRATRLAHQLRQSQVDAQRLAERMRQDIAVLQGMEGETRAAGRQVANWSLSLTAQTEAACGRAAALARDVDSLADAVRAVTVQAERAGGVATLLAETAFGTQQHVTALSGALGTLTARLDEVTLGLAHGTPDPAAVREAAEDARAQLSDMRREAAWLTRHVDRLTDAVQAQHDFGFALSHAASLQADAIDGICRHLAGTQEELTMLHAAVIDPPLTAAQLGNAVPAQRALERLPGYADAMAQILRGLPLSAGPAHDRPATQLEHEPC